MCEYSNELEDPQKDNIKRNSTTVKKLIDRFEQLNNDPPCKVRIDSTFKVRKYLSLNIMNENSEHTFPILNENVVNKFFQLQNSSFKSSESVCESKLNSEREQKKRSESLQRKNKNSAKWDGNKKSTDSFLNKYFRSLSDSKTNKRNGSSDVNSKWYLNNGTAETEKMKTNKKNGHDIDDSVKKKFKERTFSIEKKDGSKTKSSEQAGLNQIKDMPKKKSNEQENSNQFSEVPRKKSNEQENSNQFGDVPKKKSNEQENLNQFSDVPKKKSNEQENSNQFSDVPKKKFNEQENSNQFSDVPKKKSQGKNNQFSDTLKNNSNEQINSNEIDDIQKKKSKELTIPQENVQFRRKSYVLAMQADRSFNIDIDESPKEETKNSYVSKILSRFEEKNIDNVKQEVKSDVDRLFKDYHRKVKINGETREKLSLEINDVLLEKYKQLKLLTDTEQHTPSNSKVESPTAPEENEEVECITLVYNEDDGKLTRYSEDECRNMETKYMITLNETLDPDNSAKNNEQKIEEIKVIQNGSTLDLSASEDSNKSKVLELCDKIQEQLNDVMKFIEIEEISVETKTSEDEQDENIFEFSKQQHTPENIQQVQMSDTGYSTEEEKHEETVKPDKIPETTQIQVVEDDDPNITNRRRSSYLFSSVSTNSDISGDKPRLSRLYSNSFKRRSQLMNEDNKNKVEARNSFLSSLRLSFKSNCDEATDKRNRRSFRSSIFGDKKEENKNDDRRNSYMNRRKSSAASCSSYQNELLETSEYKKDKRESIASCSSCTCEETPEELITKQNFVIKRTPSCKSDISEDCSNKLLEPNRQSFLNARRNSYSSNISGTDEENPRRSIFHSDSFKKMSSQNENEEIRITNKSENPESNNIRRSRLYDGRLRKSFTEKSSKDDLQEEKSSKEDLQKEKPFVRQGSRLFNGKFQSNSADKKDDNNNNFELSEEKTNESILKFESDTEDELLEICNPYFNYISKDAYTNEWVQRTVEQLAQQTVKETEPIEEKQFPTQLRRTVDEDGLKTCTVYDEQNNPAIRLSCYDILISMSDEEFNEEQKIIQSEKQYRESIEDIQNNSQLACLIAELKSTEQNYVKISLRRLVEDYMSEMNKPDIPGNLLGKVRTIFGNADILYEKHKSKFLPDLEASHSVDDIAKCFLKYEEKIFKYYPLYTKNKPKSELLMRDYAEFFKSKQEALQDRLDLSSYLLTPIQRMAKYCQLVKSMIKECEKEGKPTVYLNKASDMLSKLMSKGNDLIALDSILNYDGDLRQEGDLLLRDTFIVQPPNRKQSYEGMIFLFQESILITQIARLSGCEYFEYQDSIKVCDMGYTDNQAEPLVFKIWYRKRDQKNYVIRANKKEKQQKWVKEIFNLLWKQLEANKMRKKKEYEEIGLNEIKLPLPRPISEPNKKNTMFKSRSNSSTKKKPSSETIWYGSFLKKFDFGDN